MTQTHPTKDISVTVAHIVPCIFLAFLIAIKFPFDIYWGNIEEFSFVNAQLIAPLAFAMLLVFTIAYVSIFLLPKSVRLAFYTLVAVLAIEIWFVGSFLHQEKFVVGQPLTFDLFSASAWLETLFLLLLLVMAVVFRARIYPLLCQSSAWLLILVSATSFVSYWKAASDYSPGNMALDINLTDTGAGYPEELLTFSSNKNGLLIIMDELQSTVLSKVLEQDEVLRAQFDGFTNFENTVAIHPNTLMAIPGILAGDSYKNTIPIRQFVTTSLAEQSFTKRLDAIGYRSDFHSMPVFCNGAMYHCSAIPLVDGRLMALLLLDLSLFRSAPMLLKPLVYNEGAWAIQSVAARMVQTKSMTEEDRRVTQLKKFTNEIRLGDDRPRFKLFHSLLTHNPENLDGECKRIKQRKGDLNDKAAQATCALRLLVDFLQKLKVLGVYDNTLIVIASDHGSDITVGLNEELFNARGIDPGHVARSQAALLVKPIGGRGAMRSTNVPAQLSDIAHTVIQGLEPGLPNVNGENLFELREDQKRLRAYWHYDDLIFAPTQDYFPKLWHYEVAGPADNAESWTLIQLFESDN